MALSPKKVAEDLATSRQLTVTKHTSSESQNPPGIILKPKVHFKSISLFKSTSIRALKLDCQEISRQHTSEFPLAPGKEIGQPSYNLCRLDMHDVYFKPIFLFEHPDDISCHLYLVFLILLLPKEVLIFILKVFLIN